MGKWRNIWLSGNISWSITWMDTNYLEEWKVYKFLQHKNYDLYKSSLDSDLRGVIETSWGHSCIICPCSDWFIAYYPISSRVFKWFFYNEIWEINNFLKTQCSSCNKLKRFIENNESFKNIYKKFWLSNQITERNWIFLLNKEKYQKDNWENLLEFESYINLSNPHVVSSNSIAKFIKDEVVIFEFELDIPNEEKFLIAAQIKALLYQRNKDWVQSTKISILKAISDSRIKLLD